MKVAASVGFELAELHLDLCGQRIDHRVLVRVARDDALDECGGRREVALSHVEQHEHGLLGQEAEPADRLRVVRVEPQIADRRAGLEALVDPAQHDLFAPGRLAFRLCAVLAAALEALEPALGHREVGERELEIELLEIACGIDAAGGMWVGRILERADDVEQRVRVPQPREMVGGQLLGAHPTFGRGRRGRQIRVGDVGLDDLLGLEDLGEPIEPLVGHLDDAHVERDPAVATGLGVAAGQRVENGRLARTGKADDGDLHRPDRNGRGPMTGRAWRPS